MADARASGGAILVALAATAVPLVFVGAYAGDAIIHLAYAERAAQGHFYEFNPGDVSSGVTSPGFLLLLTAAFRILPAAAVPIAVKVACVAGWIALVLVVFALGRRVLAPQTALVAALALAFMPGAAYNATIGMENGLFALAVWSAVLVSRDQATRRRRVTAAMLMMVATWLRPEGLFAAGIWYVAAAWRGPWRRGHASALGLIAVLVAAAAAAVWQFTWTGDLVATSVRSRLWLSSIDTHALGPLHLSPGFALRLLAYAPLTLLAVAGAPAALRADPPQRFCALLLGCGVALLSLGTGGVHLARYTIFLMPALCLLAGIGWERWRAGSRHVRRAAVATGLLWLAGVFGYETRTRQAFASPDMLAAVVAAPATRHARTSGLLTAIGAPPGGVTSVAVVEVQLRYFVDERIIVRSLDGRTDARFLAFVTDGIADDVGYLKARQVDYLLEFPRRRGADGWSLAELLALPPDGAVDRNGLRLQRLGTMEVVRITPRGSAPVFR